MKARTHRVTVIAERETNIIDMQEVNRQDHLVQLLDMGFDSLYISIERIDGGARITDTEEIGPICDKKEEI